MKKISFTLQDAPDYVIWFDVDFHPTAEGEYSVKDEHALAILIYNLFPELKKSHRRIKNLKVIDEDGNEYETEDFDIFGSFRKKEK